MGAWTLIRRQFKSTAHCICVSFAKQTVGDVVLERFTIPRSGPLNHPQSERLESSLPVIQVIETRKVGRRVRFAG